MLGALKKLSIFKLKTQGKNNLQLDSQVYQIK